MKKIFLLYIGLVLFSCTEVVVLDLETEAPRLVVDAAVQRIFDEDGEITQSVTVKLTETTSFYAQNEVAALNADVSLTDLDTSQVFELLDENNGGVYTLPQGSDFEVQDTTEYLLSITYKEEVYEATQQLETSVPVVDVIQYRNENNFDDDDETVTINVSFFDIPEEENFYIISFNDDNFVTFEDTFVVNSENPFSFDYFYDNPPSDNLRVSIYGSNERSNTYLDAILELADGDQNGPFGTLPFEARGNVVNTTDAANYPYGYFRINEAYFNDIVLVPNDDAPENPN